MRNLYVPLERDELDRLVELAQQERRRPCDQAAVLILDALKAARAPISQTQQTDTLQPLVAA